MRQPLLKKKKSPFFKGLWFSAYHLLDVPEHQLLIQLQQVEPALRFPALLVHPLQEPADDLDDFHQVNLIGIVVGRVLEHDFQ